jgi:hypothetical protein
LARPPYGEARGRDLNHVVVVAGVFVLNRLSHSRANLLMQLLEPVDKAVFGFRRFEGGCSLRSAAAARIKELAYGKYGDENCARRYRQRTGIDRTTPLGRFVNPFYNRPRGPERHQPNVETVSLASLLTSSDRVRPG